MFNNKIAIVKGLRINKSSLANGLLFSCLFFIFSIDTKAQCAMCRASLASEGNKTKAEAVNDGIVYLMVIPYILVGGIGYVIYKMKKK